MGNGNSATNQLNEFAQLKKREDAQRYVREVLNNMPSSDEIIFNAINSKDIKILLAKNQDILAALIHEVLT